MTNAADTMLELLSFPISDTRWIKIFDDQERNGGKPEIEHTKGRAVFYFLPKLGVQLNTDGTWVIVIDFFVGPQYTGELPFGLKRNFKIGDVRKLLGHPVSSEPPNSKGFGSERYHFGTYNVLISYPIADETLHLISIFRMS